jgi:hypothetical protein
MRLDVLRLVRIWYVFLLRVSPKIIIFLCDKIHLHKLGVFLVCLVF